MAQPSDGESSGFARQLGHPAPLISLRNIEVAAGIDANSVRCNEFSGLQGNGR